MRLTAYITVMLRGLDGGGANTPVYATLSCMRPASVNSSTQCTHYTDKKENQIFLLYKVILNGAVAKSYMRKGFLIYEEMHKYLIIYEEAVSHILPCNSSIQNYLIYEENSIFFFISVLLVKNCIAYFRYFRR